MRQTGLWITLCFSRLRLWPARYYWVNCANPAQPCLYTAAYGDDVAGVNLNCTILHLEDSDDDSLFFQHALKALSFIGTYRRVSSVPSVRSYLKGEGEYGNRQLYPWPDVLVLDSSLPGPESTRDLLGWLGSQPNLPKMVKIALTGDVSPVNHASLLGSGINVILSKGACLKEFCKSVEDVLRQCAR